MGRLIPAGTGLSYHRSRRAMTAAQRAMVASSGSDEREA